MALSFAVSLLSLMVAAAALWTANEIANKAMIQGKELVNDHVVKLTRMSNAHNDKVARLKIEINMIDSELQDYRQEFRKATQANLDEIEKLRTFCAGLENGWKTPRKTRQKPRPS